MWKAAFGGKSERESDRKDTASSSGRRRHRKEDDEGSVITSISRRTDSSRKKHRRHGDDEEDSRSQSRRNEGSGLTESAMRALDNDEDWEDDDETKSERRSKRSSKSRSGREDKERRREKERGDNRRSTNDEERDERRRSVVEDEDKRRRSTVDDKPSRRVIEDKSSRTRERALTEELVDAPSDRALPPMGSFQQFPGMYDAQIPRPQEHMMSGALPTLDSHVPNQFPGQMPATYSAPASQLNPHGAAADFYNDAGESVQTQPGVRPVTPMLLHNPDAHLITPHAQAAPAEDTGNGAAADFYSGKISPVSFQPEASAGPGSTPGKPQKRPSNGAGLAAAATAAAIGGLVGKTRPKPGKPERHNSAPAFASNGTVYEAPPMITGRLTDSPQTTNAGLYTAAGAVVGAAALGAAAYGASHHDVGRPPQDRPYGERPYQPSTQGSYYAPAGPNLQQHHDHEHRGPIERLKDGLLDMIADPDDVRKMEAYTEYIGVCRHCFDPRSSPWDGPRRHHYHPRTRDSFESLRRRVSTDKLRRKSSGERVGTSSRIEKETRYAASESSRRRQGISKAEMAGLGALGVGAAATGAMLLHDGKDFDDTYSVKSGHRAGSAVRRRSRSSSHERRRRSSYGVVGPEREERKEKWVIVKTRDGRTERRKAFARSRSRSRSHGSRDRGSGWLGTAAGAAAGTALVGAALSAKSRSPERKRKDEKVFVRRRSNARSRSRSSSPGGYSVKTRREGRRSPTTSHYAVRRRSRSREDEGLFGGFFSSPKKTKERKKKQAGFFTFSNDSGSSDDALAFGEGFASRSSLGRRASNSSLKGKRKLKRRTSEERVAAAVAGIGATATALAIAQRGGRPKPSSKTELGAHRETREFVDGRNVTGDDDGWEDELPSEASGASSDDAGLAFGDDHRRGRMGRQSMESIASKSSDGGVSAWGWRWGSKKQKRSSRPKDTYTTHTQGYSSPAVTDPQSRGSRQVSGPPPPMQYIDPRPVSEAGTPGSRKPSMPGAFDSYDSPSVQRPSAAPLQQPQPVAPISAAFRQGLNDNPMKLAESSRNTPTKPRRTLSSPTRNGYSGLIGDAALIGGAALATAGIIAAQQPRRKDSNVRFGLTDEQQRKDDATRQLEREREFQRAEEDRRRERQKEEERRRTERAEAAKEEARRAAREEDERRIRAEREAEARRVAREDEERRIRQQRENERQAEARRVAREEEDRRVAELERRAEEARKDAERKTRERQASEAALVAAAAAEAERRRQADEYDRRQRKESERQERARQAEEEARFRARYEAEERARREAEDRERTKSRSTTDSPQRQDESRVFEEEEDRERRRRDKQRDVDEGNRFDAEDRHDKRSKRKSSLSRDNKEVSSNAWAAPVAAGVAGAVTGAIINGALHKGRRSESPEEKSREKESSPPRQQYSARTIEPSSEHSGVPITDDDLFDPDFFKNRKRSKSEVTRQVEIARRAADKVVSDREEYYNAPAQSQAEIFAPKELLEKTAGEKERSTDPLGGNEVQVWHSSEAEVRSHFDHPSYVKGEYDIVRDALGRPVPRLNVIAPTPPPPKSPVQRAKQEVQADAGAERGRETEKDQSSTTRKRAVSWGQDQTHVYQVQTPESIIEKDSYVSARDIPHSGSTPLDDEIVVEHDDEDGSRTIRYGKADLEKDNKTAEVPVTSREDDVEEISRDDDETEYFAEAPDFRYKQPFFDSVSDTGITVDSPGTEGAPPVRGWVEDEEVNDETPKDERPPAVSSIKSTKREAEPTQPASSASAKTSRLASLIGAALAGAGATTVLKKSEPAAEPIREAIDDVPASKSEHVGEDSTWEPPLSKKDKKKRDKLAKRQSVIEEPTVEQEVTKEPTTSTLDHDDYFASSSSKKDKKKREKAVKRGSLPDSDADFVDAETGEPEQPVTAPVEEPAWEPPLSKKDKKKKDKLAKRGLSYDDDSTPSTPLEESIETIEKAPEPIDEPEWAPPLSKKEQKKRDKLAKRGLSYEDDSYPSTPVNEPEESVEIRPAIVEDTWEPPLSKKDKKKRDKLAKRGLSYEDDSMPSTPVSETEDVVTAPRDATEDRPLTQDDKERVGKLLNRKGGVTDVVSAVMTAGGVVALANAARQEESAPSKPPQAEEDDDIWATPSKKTKAGTKQVQAEEEDDIWAAPSKKTKAGKRKKKLGEPLDSDPRDIEPVISINDNAQVDDRSSDSSTTKAEKRRSMPGGWDEEEARREEATASETDNQPVNTDKPAESNDDDIWSGYESKKSKKDKKKKRNSVFNEPAVSSPLRTEVQHEDYITSKQDVTASSETIGHHTNGRHDISDSPRELSPVRSGAMAADPVDEPYGDDEEYSSSRRRKRRSRLEDDDAKSTTSSGHSRRSAEDSAVTEKKGIFGSIFGRKSDTASSKTSDKSSRDEDESESRHHRRRRTGSEYGDEDDSRSVTSSSRKHRSRDEQEDEDNPRRQRHRSRDLEKTRSSDDQSFLGSWVEDLPPLPRSRSASPVSALERGGQEEGSPVPADTDVVKHQGEHAVESVEQSSLSLEDLPPLPETPPRSPQFRPFPVRPSSASTSVPLRFRPPPPSPQSAHSRAGSLDSPVELSSPASAPRQRTPRGRTADVRSGEFKPLYLAERHSKPVEPIEDDLPSLPSSKPSSRASSVHENEQFHSAAQSVHGSPSSYRQLRLDTDFAREHPEVGDVLDSQQTTPRAADFTGIDDERSAQEGPQFYTWEDLMREEAQSTQQQAEQAVSRRDVANGLDALPALPPSLPASPVIEHDHKSFNEAVAVGVVAAGALGLAATTRSTGNEEIDHSKADATSVRDADNIEPLVAAERLSSVGDTAAASTTKEPLISRKLSKKAARKAKKGGQLSWDDEASPAATISEPIIDTETPEQVQMESAVAKDAFNPADTVNESTLDRKGQSVVDAPAADDFWSETQFKTKKRKGKKGKSSTTNSSAATSSNERQLLPDVVPASDADTFLTNEAELEAGAVVVDTALPEDQRAAADDDAQVKESSDNAETFLAAEAKLESAENSEKPAETELDRLSTPENLQKLHELSEVSEDLAQQATVGLSDKTETTAEHSAHVDTSTIDEPTPVTPVEDFIATEGSLEDGLQHTVESIVSTVPLVPQTTVEFLAAEQAIEDARVDENLDRERSEHEQTTIDAHEPEPAVQSVTQKDDSTSGDITDVPAETTPATVSHDALQIAREEPVEDDWSESFPKKLSEKDKKKQKKNKASLWDEEEPAKSIDTSATTVSAPAEAPSAASATGNVSDAPLAVMNNELEHVVQEPSAQKTESDFDFAPAKKGKKGKKSKKQKIDLWADEPSEEAEVTIASGTAAAEIEPAPSDEVRSIAHETAEPLSLTTPLSDDRDVIVDVPVVHTIRPVDDVVGHKHIADDSATGEIVSNEETSTQHEQASQAVVIDTTPVSQSVQNIAADEPIATTEPIIADSTAFVVPTPVEDDLFAPYVKKSKKEKRKSKKSTAWDDFESKESTDLSNAEAAAIVAPAIATAAVAVAASSNDTEKDDLWDFPSKKQSKKDKRKGKKNIFLPFDDEPEPTAINTEATIPAAEPEDAVDLPKSTGIMPVQAESDDVDSQREAEPDHMAHEKALQESTTELIDHSRHEDTVASVPGHVSISEHHSQPPSNVVERDATITTASDAILKDTAQIALPAMTNVLAPAEVSTTTVDTETTSKHVTPTRAVAEPVQDLDFAATLAAGLQDAGFDPDLVVNDPVFHRRASPTGVAEADPEELADFVPTKRRKSKKQSASSTPEQLPEPAIVQSSIQHDDFDAVLDRGLSESGFDPALLKQSASEEQVVTAQEPEEDLSFFTSAIKRKGKKNKKSKTAVWSEESSSSTPIAVAAEMPTDSWEVDNFKDNVLMEPTLPQEAPAQAVGGHDAESSRAIISIEADPESLDWDVSSKKRGKKGKKKNSVAVTEDASSTQLAQPAEISQSPLPPVEPDVTGAVNMLGGEGEMDIEEQDKAYRAYKKNKRKAKKEKYAAFAVSDEGTSTNTPENEQFVTQNVISEDAQDSTARSDADLKDESMLSRASTPDQRRKVVVHTSEVSQSLPLAVDKTPRIEDRHEHDGSSVVAGTLLAGAAVALATHSVARERSQSPMHVATEPSWSFSPLDREAPAFETPTRQQELTRDVPVIRESTSHESLSSKRNVDALHVETTRASDWKLAMPKHRAKQESQSTLEAPRSRTPSYETPLDPTTRNRASYLFQSTPETTPENKSKQPVSEGSSKSREIDREDSLRVQRAMSPLHEQAVQQLDTILEESHAVKRSIDASPGEITRPQAKVPRQAFHEDARPHHETSPSVEAKRRAVSSPLYAEHEERPAMSRRVLSDHRSPSVLSNRSNASNGFPRIPEELRSFSRASSNGSVTPSLRRISMSGDLRAASRASNRRGESGSGVGQHSSPKTIPFEPPPTPPLYDEDIIDAGASRAGGMADVYQGYGDHQGSHISPTRPPSVRKRQSMHIIELESRLDQLAAENRALSEARRELHGGAPDHALRQTLEQREYELHEKDVELNRIRALLAPMQVELQRLTEINRNLVDDANGRYATLQAEHEHAHEQWQSSTRELDALRSQQVNLATNVRDAIAPELNAALAEKDSEIRKLREELEIATERIRALQVSIQSNKDATFLNERDEDYIDGACQKLCQHAQQWVLRFSKTSDKRICRLSTEINDEKIEARLDNAILDGSDVDKLLSDRTKRRDVFMSVVTTMIWEYVFTRYLFGMDREQRQKLKTLEKTLAEVGPPRAVTQWRAITLSLLSKRPSFQEQCALDTEAVAHEIFAVLCTLLPPPSTSEQQLLQSLQRVIKIAVDLSIEMRTQRAEYIMLPPLQPDYDANGDLARQMYFNAQLMNERSGNFSSNAELEAQRAVVKIVLFPPIVKKGDDHGEGADEIVVCPAQVLVHNDGGKGKKVVRVMSGAMEIDDGRVSRQSFTSTAPAQSAI